MHPTVLIIGAGTGGLALAHGLRRAGIDVRVFERDRVRTDGLHGYRVGIDPDGSRALRALLPGDLYATFAATCAEPAQRFLVLDEHYRTTMDIPIPPAADPMLREKSVSRMTLRQVLITGLEDVIEFDRTFERYEELPDGRVRVHFTDGSTADGDLLVGADGSGSRVRRQRLPQAKLIPTGIVGVAGKIELTDETRGLVPAASYGAVSMVMAPRGEMCILHTMRFPWDRAGEIKTGIGGTDASLIEAWPGLQFDNTRDYLNWGWSSSDRRLPDDVFERSPQQLVDLVLEHTADWDPRFRELVRRTDLSTCFAVNIRTTEPVPDWAPSAVTLLGDAIHTMTPGRGVGANTALRDAVGLCRALVGVRDGSAELIAAVGDYETRMRAYAWEAVKKSRAQMDGSGPIHRPVIGRAMLGLQRGIFRTINALPPVKRRMGASMGRFRGADRADEFEIVGLEACNTR